MYTVSHDYYAILGVAKDATTNEIRGQYRRLMKKHHPDQYNGLKAKYQEGGDEVLLKLLEEKIREAGECCKLLNEALEVLTDSEKRRQYDNETVAAPTVEEPKISISPQSISFGTMGGDEKKAAGFTVNNSGGPAASVNIDWESGRPSWGELTIEPDEDNVFPIKVIIAVSTKTAKIGKKLKRILVTVDGRVYSCEIFLAVRSATSIPVTPPPPAKTSPAAAPKPTPPPPPPPPPDLVISGPTEIDFGELEKGQSQSEFFFITNKGGPAKNVEVDWDGPKPDWAHLIVEPDPINTFPIRVSVRVDTSVTEAGKKLGKIKITVD
jgi:curved DNA-binding protein CbpA